MNKRYLPLNTIIDKFEPIVNCDQSYQSEEDLEKKFISDLIRQGFEYKKDIKTEKELIDNFKLCLEQLNNCTFSENEWNQVFKEYIENITTPKESLTKFSEQHIIEVLKDDETLMNVKIYDKKNVEHNILQVINQFHPSDEYANNYYDVTILLNGLPIIHIELKRRGGSIEEAFNQIRRYRRETMCKDNNKFYWYIQMFIASNGTETKYYSSTLISEEQNDKRRKFESKNTYKKALCWTDSLNNQIHNLEDFTNIFFKKNTTLNVILFYSVLTLKKQIRILRPYQICAAEKILIKTKEFIEKPNPTYDERKGGYIWHSTGSGKTLTSFKSSTLILDHLSDKLHKVVFVVDRKDLDEQTKKEFEKFQKNCVSSSKNTDELVEVFNDNSKKRNIVVTTIQKLGWLTGGPKISKVKDKDKKIVFIFDECHRTNAGEMHKRIKEHFKNSLVFGFTGTPIFPERQDDIFTTPFIFGDQLHSYRIDQACKDGIVLPFQYNQVKTMSYKDECIPDINVKDIDRKAAFFDKRRLKEVATFIVNNISNQNKQIRETKFNALFAVSSIEMAIEYYQVFKEVQNELGTNLKITSIFTYDPNDANSDDEGNITTEHLNSTQKESLRQIMYDYNKMYNTTYDLSTYEGFHSNLTTKIKEVEIDLVIVVNILLTGFDSEYLSTLYCDKKLEKHGLIQAFSRTNRISNYDKRFGKIFSFRNNAVQMEEAYKIYASSWYGAKNIGVPTYEKFYEFYKEIYENFIKTYPNVEYVFKLSSIIEKAKFIKALSELIEMITKLLYIQEFDNDNNKKLHSDRYIEDLKSLSIEFRTQLKKVSDEEKTNINEYIDYCAEIVSSTSYGLQDILIDVNNILKGHKETSVSDLIRKIKSSLKLFKLKDLIEWFVNKLITNNKVVELKDSVKITCLFNEELNKICQENKFDYYKLYEAIKASIKTLKPLSLSDINKARLGDTNIFERLKKVQEEIRDLFNNLNIEEVGNDYSSTRIDDIIFK
ncbi:type I restriction endonuclease subunit R, EcoR124 family [Mycoplasma crocodyli]|uniref:Type I restriction enzyme endonuclease subunit n=1 Tax=Mycoplasma crocodyli (strain ATCC 51981 / MP145) TaxID=512564 RepID=D5E6A8_MYCCM|nr:type I restriction endonuclease subunit R [Mycoplasma crocodyli]ADE19869.1 type I restriction-modification system, endonuclease [Mycoplasma crocodyli MP145]